MAYLTEAEADTMLSSTEWTGASSAAKQHAIDTAELWIDERYTCVSTDPVQDNIQLANALLAEMYIKGTLFKPRDSSVKSKTVKAGSVETSKEFEGGQMSEDALAEIKLLLGAECSINLGATFKTVRV